MRASLWRSCTLVAGLALLAVSLPSQAGTAATIDRRYDQTGSVDAGAVFDLPVLGRGGVPASGVGSVALNVTVTRPTAAGYVTVWPTGQPRPNASNLNFVEGQTVPNMVIVPVGVGGQVSIFNESGSTDVIVDVLGWFPIGSSFSGLTPARLLDSRVPSGGTVDGSFSGIGQVAGGAVFNLPVSGRGGVPTSGVGSVVLNVTVARPSATSYLTVWPSGQRRPNASNLNFVGGQTVPNMVIVPVGADGQISILNETGLTDVIVDVLGWFPTGPAFTGVTPRRLLDTRVPSGGTVDGAYSGGGQLAGGTVFNLPVAGRGGVPVSGAGSVALNVTVARPSAASFLTVWPKGQPRPNASNLNFTPGQTVPNMVIVPVGADGQISIINESGSTDALVDVLGWFPTGPAFTGLTPARLLDTRKPLPSLPPPPRAAELDGVLAPVAGTHFGANASKRGSSSQYDSILAFERDLGRRLSVINRFHEFSAGVTSDFFWDREHIDDGRIVMLSWRATDNAGSITGAADPDRAVKIVQGRFDTEIRAMAREVKELNAKVLIRFNWEMDQSPGAPQYIGTPSEFIAAWRYVHDMFAAEGATNAVWVWAPRAASFNKGAGQSFYPGDQYVDWIGGSAVPIDSYRDPATVYGAWNDWASQKGKPMLLWVGLRENPDDPQWKAKFLTDLRGLIEGPWSQVKSLVYYHANSPKGYDYWADTSTASWNAFRSMGCSDDFATTHTC